MYIIAGLLFFKGTRAAIKTLFDYIESGYSLEDFLKDFDWVSKKNATEVLELAKDTLTSEKMLHFIDENIIR